MQATILHSDLNCFYASVECLLNPELRGKPMAVCGSARARHGIVLAKSQEAKMCGVKTGLAIWEAKRLCPDLIIVDARQDVYLHYARMVREIYKRYTPRVEPFGLDEAWLDVTGQNGKETADALRRIIKYECGLTASIGVASNKIYAKLGSDYRKPDATTVFLGDAISSIVFLLPASDLLFVGPATARRLKSYHILTIGDLAQADPLFLKSAFGKNGLLLRSYARGEACDPVRFYDDFDDAKSIGHSTTLPADITTQEEANRVLMLLCEAVSVRLRKHKMEAGCVSLWLRKNNMTDESRQLTLQYPTNLSMELLEATTTLLRKLFNPLLFRQQALGIRSLGVRASHLQEQNKFPQLTLDGSAALHQRRLATDAVMDTIRRRYGHDAISRATLLGNAIKDMSASSSPFIPASAERN